MLNGTHIERANLPSELSLVAQLSSEQLTELIGECERLKALYWARLMSISIPVVPPEPNADERDDWVTAKEGAATLMR